MKSAAAAVSIYLATTVTHLSTTNSYICAICRINDRLEVGGWIECLKLLNGKIISDGNENQTFRQLIRWFNIFHFIWISIKTIKKKLKRTCIIFMQLDFFVIRTARAPGGEESGTDPDENYQLLTRTHHIQHVRFTAQVVLFLQATGQTAGIAFP
jgi:hypothetical protein